MPPWRIVATEDLRNDKAIILATAESRGFDSAYLDRLREDRGFFLKAVRDDPSTMLLTDMFCRDREIVLAAVTQKGADVWRRTESSREDHVLQYVSKEFKQDREIVLAAVQTSGFALEYVAEVLKKDREIALAAVIEDPRVLKRFAPEEFKRDREFVLAAVMQNSEVLRYAAKEIKHDREFVLTAVTQCPPCFRYAARDVKKDPEIKKAAGGMRVCLCVTASTFFGNDSDSE